jgi:hypothetical protein
MTLIGKLVKSGVCEKALLEQVIAGQFDRNPKLMLQIQKRANECSKARQLFLTIAIKAGLIKTIKLKKMSTKLQQELQTLKILTLV